MHTQHLQDHKQLGHEEGKERQRQRDEDERQYAVEHFIEIKFRLEGVDRLQDHEDLGLREQVEAVVAFANVWVLQRDTFTHEQTIHMVWNAAIAAA